MADKKPIVDYGGKQSEMLATDKVGIVNLATGVPDGTKFIRDDGVLATPGGGAVINGYIAKTANYTLLTTDYTVNCTANSFNITLPTAIGVTGQIYNIKNTGTGIITILTTSSQTVDGNTSGFYTISQWSNMQVQSNGANWIIL